ncbi:MAG: S41 family peptidase [bacterium]
MLGKTIIVLWLSAFVAFGCENMFFENEPADSQVENFMVLWTTFKDQYGPFEQRNTDWAQVFETFRPRVNDYISNKELYQIFTQMLAKLDDAHVTLTAPRRELWNANRIIRLRIGDPFFDLEKITTIYLQNDFVVSGPFTFGVIKGSIEGSNNLGYLHIEHFETLEPSVLDGILEFMKNFEIIGVIIDLRHNFGGDFRNGLLFASRFADQRRLAFSSKAKSGPGPNDFAPRVNWYIEPKGNAQYAGPVVVLTDRYTVSAAERTVLAFKVLPHVRTMGDTTSGAHGEKIGKELPNGWFYSLTPQIVFAADGLSYEGMGIPPDIFVDSSKSERSSDPVLAVATRSLLADGDR